MQVFCDLENKEMPISQDNIVVLRLFICYSTILFIALKIIVGR